VPFKENSKLNEELSFVERQREFSRSFGNVWKETFFQLDSVNLNEAQTEMVEARISENLRRLTGMNMYDSISGQTNFHQYLIKSLANLKEAKKQLRDLNAKNVDASKLREQIDNLQTQLHHARNTPYQPVQVP
jgi:hypothetical protein